jgi:hypothetical protein
MRKEKKEKKKDRKKERKTGEDKKNKHMVGAVVG